MLNRRKGHRVVFKATVTLKFDSRQFENYEVRDLSVRGISVYGVKGVAAGEQGEVELHLAGRAGDLPLKMRGEVVRVTADLIALHFLEMDDDTYFHLRNIVIYNTKDLAEVEKEFPALFANQV